MLLVLCAVAGYLLGSLSFAIIYSKNVLHDDVRNHGSGNAGATNVARTFGWKAGIITFLCDFGKCALSALIGRLTGGEWGMAAATAACLIGHCFPLFFGFKGGKAVSTGACVALLIDWRLFAIAIAIFLILALTTKLVSLSSISAAFSMIVFAFILNLELPLKLLAIFTGCLVIVMHYPNIKRLLNGTETKFKAGNAKK